MKLYLITSWPLNVLCRLRTTFGVQCSPLTPGSIPMYPYLGKCRSGSHPAQARGKPTHMHAALHAPLYTDACMVAWVALLITMIIVDLSIVVPSVLLASLHRNMPRRLFKVHLRTPAQIRSGFRCREGVHGRPRIKLPNTSPRCAMGEATRITKAHPTPCLCAGLLHRESVETYMHTHARTQGWAADGMTIAADRSDSPGCVTTGSPWPLFHQQHSAGCVPRERSSPGFFCPSAGDCDTETNNCTYSLSASCQQTVGLTARARASSNPAPPLSPLITCCVLPRAPASLQPSRILSRFYLASGEAACLSVTRKLTYLRTVPEKSHV